jgi:hypothetical protein
VTKNGEREAGRPRNVRGGDALNATVRLLQVVVVDGGSQGNEATSGVTLVWAIVGANSTESIVRGFSSRSVCSKE